GMLRLAGVNGDAAGIPIAVSGGIRILGGVRFALGATLEADLARMRRLLAFSTKLPLAGDLATYLQVDGPSNELHVRGVFASPSAASYQDFSFAGAAGEFYYADGHVTLS